MRPSTAIRSVNCRAAFRRWGCCWTAFGRGTPTELSARLAAAHTIALQLGWCLFGDFLRASTGLEDVDDRTFARSIGDTVALILDARVQGRIPDAGAHAPWRDSIAGSPIRSQSALGGWAPLQGTLEHVGRKSGKRYRTPLNIFDTDDGYVILIGYGLESHWVQNVLAGGPATIHKHGKTVPVANPRLVSKAEAAPLVTIRPASSTASIPTTRRPWC